MNDDLISRLVAIEALKREASCGNRDCEKGLMIAADILELLPSVQPEIIRCKDCKHFHYDMQYVIQGVPVLGHEVCDFWGNGCKTSENGFCSYVERKEK